MNKLLVIHSSLFDANIGVTRRLTAQMVAGFIERNRDLEIRERDLALSPPAHAGLDLIAGSRKTLGDRTQAESEAVADAMAHIEDLLWCDTMIVGAPMYNAGIPSALKAWIDNVSLAGITFRYTADGKEGLVPGKKAYLITSRGGRYGEDGPASGNYADPHLKCSLSFLGIDDVDVVVADAQAFPHLRDDAFAIAQTRITDLIAI